MKLFLYSIFLTINVMALVTAKAQEYFDPNFETQGNRIFDTNIHSVFLHPVESPSNRPITDMSGSIPLRLSFDDFSMESQNYLYTYFLCDANWKKVDQEPIEYIDGITSDFINIIEYSRSTFHRYIHYELDFPTEQTKFRRAGNYLLVVYLDNPNEPVFVRKFHVLNDLVKIEATVDRSVSDRTKKQQLNFTVAMNNAALSNSQNITVVVEQNFQTFNSIRKLKPTFIENNIYTYNDIDINSFDAINEYRQMNTYNPQAITGWMDSIHYQLADGCYVRMKPAQIHAEFAYNAFQDNNGRSYIGTITSTTDYAATEADYCLIDFYFPPIALPKDHSIYLFGELTNFEISDDYRLNFQKVNQLYHAKVLLKQGIHDYIYVVSDGKTGNVAATEGNFALTSNEYSIFVYFYNPARRADELIGYKHIKNY